jgi:hypothetical protein
MISRSFLIDIFPIIPFNFIFTNKTINFENSRLLFLTKLIRMYKGLELLDTAKFMNFVKNYYNEKL